MRFEPLMVDGAYAIHPEPRHDERGHFARIWCQDELSRQGLNANIVQINTGFSPKAGTLRGMHLQVSPHAEVKIARCTSGAAFDVVVDLRPSSPTYRRWCGIRISPADGTMVYVPEGCAHGYLTLEPDTEVMYSTSCVYHPQSARGVRYDDPSFAIEWPGEITLVSQADRSWPDFTDPTALVA